jgi:DNA-binding transcriptional ArsR family regulator
MSTVEAPAEVFAALGDPVRLHLVERLGTEGPLSISRLTEGTTISRQAIARHLHVLSDAGLLQGERRGREHVFALEPRRIAAARRHLDRISAGWDNALDRLRAYVED